MIPNRIKVAIENSNLNDAIDKAKYGTDWSNYTRTVFEQIARRVNTKVTSIVRNRKYLIDDLLVLGKEELDNLLFKLQLDDTKSLIKYFKRLGTHNPHCWISGKTLHAYWNGGNAKDKKLNVLLTYLEVEVSRWDDWKSEHLEESLDDHKASNVDLLKSHYLGFYYRYYQKTDASPILIKTPLIIYYGHGDEVTVLTKTLGHEYKSSSITIRGGSMYIDCENITWNEKESHIYNIGFETNPQLLLGVSTTLDRRGQALGIKNVLVKQSVPFDYSQTEAVEISFEEDSFYSDEEKKIIDFFKKDTNSLIKTPLIHSYQDLTN